METLVRHIDNYDFPYISSGISAASFDNFLLNSAPTIIRKFNVEIQYNELNPVATYAQVVSWVNLAVKCGVQSMKFITRAYGTYKSLYKLPAILLQCQSLVQLELVFCTKCAQYAFLLPFAETFESRGGFIG